MDKKFYGLIIPDKSKKFQPKLKSIFDSDEDESPALPKKTNKSEFSSSKLSAKNKLLQQKLAEDDPTIYEYDSVYDSLKQNQAEKQTSAKKDGAKYITSLLKAAEKRKKEQERRQEKKIQHERDKEGDEFQDKEAFVTSAYKKKMLEMQEEEEQERLVDQIDDMMDVTKQKDLSGFYRHYLKQAVGEEAVPEFGDRETKVKELTKQVIEKDSASSKTTVKDDKDKFQSNEDCKAEADKDYKAEDDKDDKDCEPHSSQHYENLDADSYSSSEEDLKDHDRLQSVGKDIKAKSPVSHSSSSSDYDNKFKQTVPVTKKRSHSKYKQKSSDDDLEDSQKLKSSSNRGRKSSRRHKAKGKHSSDSLDDDNDSNRQFKKAKITRNERNSLKPLEKPSGSKQNWTNSSPMMHDEDADYVSESSDSEITNDDGTSKNHTKNKCNIMIKFSKRTVGEIFDQAQARYFKRMAAKKIG